MRLYEQYPGAVRRLLIYGSKARCNAGPESDLDVLMIVNDKAGRQKRQLRWVGSGTPKYRAVGAE